MPSPARILMCRPDFYRIEYEINPWMHRDVDSDPAESRAQWLALRDVLTDLGAIVEEMEPAPDLPDMVFTANAGLVYHDLFLSSRFRFGVRQGETSHFDAWFSANGFRVESLPEGMYFEGAGDALFCGDTLFAGYRFRSDARSHHWLGDRLGVEVLPLELIDPRYYHLDTCFCPLGPDEAVYFPGAFDSYGQDVLKSRIPGLIEVSASEAVSFTCNAVVVGRSVVLNEAAPKLAGSLRAAGYEVHPRRLTEFIKAGGSAKCLTLRLDGEEAAAWKAPKVASRSDQSP